ncbi:MAG: iron ABC transporter permease [Pseudomonadota bacterium]
MNLTMGQRRQSSLPLPLSLAALALAIVAGAMFSLSTGGRTDIGLGALFAKDPTSIAVIWDIRMPRSVAAALIGINLGLAGLTLQAITRNPLASPAILGINQGAAFGLALALIVPQAVPLPPDGMATLGALAAGLLTFAIAGGFGERMESIRLILGGVAVGALAYALVRFAYTLEDELTRTLVRWTVGDITDMRWPPVLRMLIWTVPGVLLAMVMAHRFNLMSMGQDVAHGLGADPRKTLIIGMLLAASLTGVSVSVAGPIAFAGLIVPHIAKLLFGPDHRVLVPVTALLGAALMLIADGLSKVVTAPIETPLGIIVALIGAPWFLVQTLTAKDLE